MNVVLIYFYSKRFRFAPSFNKYFFLFDHCGILQLALVDLCWVKQKKGGQDNDFDPLPWLWVRKTFFTCK